MKKAGFAAIVGLPNVGKSTLMNRLIGQKIAITSYRPQTTRTRIRTIYTDEQGQIVFVDTPGLLRPQTRLGEYMARASEGSLREVDVILLLVEPRKPLKEDDRRIVDVVRRSRTPVVLVINKVDKVKKDAVLPVIAAYSEAFAGEDGRTLAAVMPVSARTGEGLEELREQVFAMLPEGEPFYDEDLVTTETERDIAAEIVREKALRLLRDEVPHGIAVTIERMKERKTKNGEPITDIDASIICDKESHKSIIIGRGGEMLRRIGTDARRDIEEMLQMKCSLKLFVKVRGNWKDDETQMRSYGYDLRKI